MLQATWLVTLGDFLVSASHLAVGVLGLQTRHHFGVLGGFWDKTQAVRHVWQVILLAEPFFLALQWHSYIVFLHTK